MDISVIKDKLTVYHTEVNEEFEGRGFAKILLEKLVSYARKIISKLFRCVLMFMPSSNAVPTNTAMYGLKKNCKILKL
jgi:GNAT superfamily N-acetyltransferase